MSYDKGASMLVPGNVGYAKNISDISRKYGEYILDTLINEVGMGFQPNSDEDKILASDSYQEKIALALFNDIDKV